MGGKHTVQHLEPSGNKNSPPTIHPSTNRVLYPMCNTRRKKVDKPQRPIVQTLLNTMGLNRHFPRDVVFADSEYFGLSFQSIYAYQGHQNVRLFMGLFCKGDRTAKLMWVLKNNVELLSGSNQCPLEYLEDCEKPWLPLSWIIGLGQYLHNMGTTIQCNHGRLLTQQRENDKFLMTRQMNMRKKCMIRKHESV